MVSSWVYILLEPTCLKFSLFLFLHHLHFHRLQSNLTFPLAVTYMEFCPRTINVILVIDIMSKLLGDVLFTP